jgi:hypothetical protein
MATKLIALNSNNFLRWSRAPYNRFARLAIPMPGYSTEIGNQRSFKDLTEFRNWPAFVLRKKNFQAILTNHLSPSRFNRCRFPSFCVDLMDGLATLDASCQPVATEVYF